MSGQVPAGWFPDPEHPNQLRYWDGSHWTEHRSPMPAQQVPQQPVQPVQPHPAQSPQWAANGAGAPHTPAEPAKRNGTWWKVTLGVLGVLMVIGMFTGNDDKTTPVSASGGTTTQAAVADEQAAAETTAPTKKAAPKKAAPAKPKVSQPKDETAFLAAVTKAQDAADDADNDLQRGAALSTRNKALCDAVGRGRVTDWVGEVTTLDANGDGKGILEIEVADDVHIMTWNNFMSDAVDETMIEPGPLFDKVLKLEEGQKVAFSGKFVEELGGDTCINDSRLTLDGKLAKPDFIFRFSDVKALD